MDREEVERRIRKLKRAKRKMVAAGATSEETRKIRRAIRKLRGEG